MTRRTVAWLVAVPLLFALWGIVVLKPLPFVTYRPGLTVDLLGQAADKPVIEVEGHMVYRDKGQLRLTTIYVTGAEQRVSLVSLMRAWFDEDAAVYPRATIYPEGTTQAEDRAQSQAMMVNSQDIAVANALKALDYTIDQVIQVSSVQAGTPAEGKLKLGDQLVSVNGTPITTAEDITDAIAASGTSKPVVFKVLRNNKPVTVEVTPALVDQKPRVGISLGPAFDLPFKVSLNVNPDIGGPSAGLMFSLAIYDTLTPGSLTNGKTIAGTGTAEMDGSVGAIGGIPQKIAAAKDAGAALFFVPKDNCTEALSSPHADEIELVRADTMQSAVDSLETWVKNPRAALPSCS